MTDIPMPDSARYSDLSAFVRLLGTRGRVQILDTLLRKHYTELSVSDISSYTGMSKSTFTRNKDDLLELEMIQEHQSESGPAKYKINKDNEVVKTLVRFHLDLEKHAEKIHENTSPGNGRREIMARIASREMDETPRSRSSEDSGSSDFEITSTLT